MQQYTFPSPWLASPPVDETPLVMNGADLEREWRGGEPKPGGAHKTGQRAGARPAAAPAAPAPRSAHDQRRGRNPTPATDGEGLWLPRLAGRPFRVGRGWAMELGWYNLGSGRPVWLAPRLDAFLRRFVTPF